MLEAPVEAAAKANNTLVIYLSCNVTDPDDVSSKFTQLVGSLRCPIRGLVACAGISDNGPVVDFPASSFRKILDVNVTGTFLVAQAVAKEMIKANVSGSIVLVASMSGYVSNKANKSESQDQRQPLTQHRESTPQATTHPKPLYTSLPGLWRQSGGRVSTRLLSESTLFRQDIFAQQRLPRRCRSLGWNRSGWGITCCSDSARQMSSELRFFICWVTEVVS